MAKPPLIIGVGGTTRPGSTTELAIGVALGRAHDLGCETRLFGGALLAALPHYAPEHRSRTDKQAGFVDAVRGADGFILGSPGYHGGVSGLVKNALDLVEDTAHDTRPYLEDRPVGLIVTAFGWQAGGSTLSAMRAIVHALRGWPTPYGAMLNSSTTMFDAGGDPAPAAAAALRTVGDQVAAFAMGGKLQERN